MYIDRTSDVYWQDQPGGTVYWTWTGSSWEMLSFFNPGGGNLVPIDDTGGGGTPWTAGFRPTMVRVTYRSANTGGGFYEFARIRVRDTSNFILATLLPTPGVVAPQTVESALDFANGNDIGRFDVSQIFIGGNTFFIDMIEFFDDVPEPEQEFWTGFVGSEEIL